VKLCRTLIELKVLRPYALFSRFWVNGTSQRSARQSEIANEAMPCLFSSDGSDVMLIVERHSDGALLVFDGSSASWKKVVPANQLGLY